jgi:hypothetical protein
MLTAILIVATGMAGLLLGYLLGRAPNSQDVAAQIADAKAQTAKMDDVLNKNRPQ